MPRALPGGAGSVFLEDRIPEIIATAEAETQLATRDVAQFIVKGAKDRSRVDTGAMKDGWQARRAPASKTYEVFNPVRYTIFHEIGTYKMPAQPMLAPAVEDARHVFVEEVSAIWEQLAVGGTVSRRARSGSLAHLERLRPGSVQ
jgi:HK97 gp10 family phage protein